MILVCDGCLCFGLEVSECLRADLIDDRFGST